MINNEIGQDTRITKRSPKLKRGIVAVSMLITFTVISVIASPSISRWNNTDARISASDISTAVVTHGRFKQDISASGSVIASHAPTLSSTDRGIVQFLVKPGETVANGDVIGTITSPQLLNQLAQQENVLAQYQLEMQRLQLQQKSNVAEIERAKDDALIILNAANREFQRATRSRNEELISDIDFQQRNDEQLAAQLTYKHAEKALVIANEMAAFETKVRDFELQQRELTLTELKRRVDALFIKSPVDGVIGNWLVENSSQVDTQQGLISVIDYSRFEVALAVAPVYTQSIEEGMTANITVSGNIIEATIYAISPELQNNMLMVHARFNIDQNTQGLKQNQFVTAKINLENIENALLLPRGAYFDSGQRKYVFVVGENKIAIKRAVKFGKLGLKQVEVLSGLSEGETIIRSAVSEFFDSSNVALK